MAYGKLASACNVYSDFARHCVIRMQGPCWYFRSLDGYRSNLWAHGGYHCEGAVQVCRPPFFAKEICPNVWVWKGIPHVRYFRRLPARRPMHNPWDLCISWRSSRSQVGHSRCLFPVSLFTELVAQWRYANHCHRGGHHVRAHWRPDIHPTNYGSLLF